MKTGRPTIDPKINSKRVRLSLKDQEKLTYCVEVTNRSEADIIREGIDIVYKKIKRGANKNMCKCT